MSERFQVYESPLSEESKKLRRNSVLLSALCLFIGITNQIPTKFSLLGINFESNEQQITLGWFLFCATTYAFLHFIAVAGVEVAKWLHPLFSQKIAKKDLLMHPAFDETDFIDLSEPYELEDKNEISTVIQRHSELKARTQLRHLYNLIYIQIMIELITPIAIGIWGLSELAHLISLIDSTTL